MFVKVIKGYWRDESVVKGTYCFYRRLGFTYGFSHLPVNPAPMNLTSSSLHGYCAHIPYIPTDSHTVSKKSTRQKILIHFHDFPMYLTFIYEIIPNFTHSQISKSLTSSAHPYWKRHKKKDFMHSVPVSEHFYKEVSDPFYMCVFPSYIHWVNLSHSY